MAALRHRTNPVALKLIVFALCLTGSVAFATVCDTDANGKIDFQDIFRIQLEANGQLASVPNDPGDADQNGIITNNDVRICQKRCTRNDCQELSNKRPRALNDSASTTVNQPVTINLVANDIAFGGRITASNVRIVTKPRHGRVVNNHNGTVTYTPDSGFVGSDKFRYEVKDNHGVVSNEARVFITVSANNFPPITNAGTDINAATGQPVTLNGSQSFDPEHQLLSFSWRFQTVPATSALTDASIVNSQTAVPHFTPDVDGVYVLALTVSDGVNTNVATVRVTATTANIPPNVNAGTDRTALVGATVNLTGTASDPDNAPSALVLRWFFVTPLPASSTLTDANISNGNTTTASFTPDVPGIYTLGFEAFDGIATVQDTVIVTAAFNVAPNADAGTNVVVPLGSPASLNGSASNDPDNAPNPLTFQWSFVSVASTSTLVNGSLTGATTATPSFTPDVLGLYVLSLDVFDGGLHDPTPANVTVKANVAPVGNADSYTVTKNVTLNEPALTGVLANDTDGNNDPLTAVVDSNPAHGTLTLNTDGSFTYTPTTNFVSPPNDTFTYHANDGSVNGGTPVANADSTPPTTVTITVNPPNVAPSFTKGSDQTVNEDAGAQTVAGWATAIDDGDPSVVQTLAFTATPDNAALFSVPPAVSPTGTLTYTPAANANGTATVTLSLQDNGGTANGGVDTSAAQAFTITVNSVNDAPAFTKGADQTVLEDAGAQTVPSWATAISAGPSNESGQTLTFNVTGNTNPGLFGAGPTVAANGTLTYTPAANANGTATVTVALQDNGGTANGGVDTSTPQTFVITVTAVNDVPSFTSGGNVTVNEDAGAQSTPWATAISAGPANESGQTLTFSVSNDSNGLFSAQPAISAAGVLTFTTAANANGSATVTVTLSDNGGTTNGGIDTTAAQTFSIAVTAVNDPPVVTPPAAYAAHAHIGINVPDGSTDLFEGSTVTDPADGIGASPFTLTAGTATSAQGVSVTINANGSFSYNPPVGFTGDDTFTYQVCDSGVPGSACTNATATVAVSGPLVWFVDNSLGAAGDGRLSTPFNTLAAADTAANTSGDHIFVYTGSGNYTGGFTLLTNQKLVGQGVADTNFDTALGISPPANSVARPAINGTRPSINGTVTLATGITARGFNISNTTTTGISGSGATGLTVNQVSVTTTTGTAVNLANSGGTVSFSSVSSNGATNGILLNTTTGSFTVTGTGTAGSGGTIQNSTDDGIIGTNVAGLSLTNMNVTNNGNSLTDEGIELIDPRGAIAFTSVNVTGNAHNNVFIDDADNTGGNSSLTVSGGTIGNHSVANANANTGMLMQIRGTAVLGTSTISGAIFENNRVLGLQVTGGDTANVSDLTVSGNTFRDTGTGNSQEISMDIAKAQSSSITVKVLNNTVTGHNSHGMNFFTGAEAGVTGTYNARIEGNTIGSAGTVNSGSVIGNCMRININGDTVATVLVNNNVMRQCPSGRGIEAISRNGTGGLDLTVTNNDIDPNDTSGFPLAAIFAQSNCVGVCNSLRADIRGNTVPSGTVTDVLSGNISAAETSGASSPPGTSTFELVDTPSGPGGQTCAQQLAAASPANNGSVAASAGCALIAGPINTPP